MIAPLGVVLAGGQARRMGGGDKGLLALGNGTILSNVIDRISPQVGELAINANGDPSRFAGFGLPVLADTATGFLGPLAGVLAGLDWAAQLGASHIVTVAGDTPFAPADLVPRLLLAAETEGLPIAMAATPDAERAVARHPTFGLWPVALKDDLRAALKSGTRKVVAFSDSYGVAAAMFGAEPFDPFFNVNTPQDLDRAKNILTLAP
jgi:molybdopterin-guanine dinucleotide biosynthesis protein A